MVGRLIKLQTQLSKDVIVMLTGKHTVISRKHWMTKKKHTTLSYKLNFIWMDVLEIY